jgi:hypothetical protein
MARWFVYIYLACGVVMTIGYLIWAGRDFWRANDEPDAIFAQIGKGLIAIVLTVALVPVLWLFKPLIFWAMAQMNRKVAKKHRKLNSPAG